MRRAPLAAVPFVLLLALILGGGWRAPGASAQPSAPAVTGISPTFGPAAGGTAVTITGRNFAPGQNQTIFQAEENDTFLTNVNCTSSTTCTATTPGNVAVLPGQAQSTPVQAIANGQAGPEVQSFTWFGLPLISSLTPASGVAGATVDVQGGFFPLSSVFPGAASISFGGAPAANVSCSDRSLCTATVPVGSGTVPVTITTPGGTSNSLPFTYAAPTVAGLSRTSGPESGGTIVTVEGSGFSTVPGATTIRFGGAVVTSFTCISSERCNLNTPAGTGTVDVTVTVAGQTSTPNPAARFTYIAPDATALRVSATVFVNGAPAGPGLLVSTRMNGGVPCGQGTVGAGGLLSIQVFSAGQVLGCGSAGDAITFLVGAQVGAATPPVMFQQGGQAKTTLSFGSGPAPTPTPAPTPAPKPTPAPQPQPAAQPMQVNGTVATKNGPVQSGTVQALVGGVVCGQGTLKAGAFQLTVASAATQPGCGTNGTAVLLRVDTSVAGSVNFVAGGSATLTLTLT